MAKYRNRVFTGQNVYEAALDRVRYLYKRFDNVAVSFSGGKDSTAVLHVAITVAKELGRVPVRAVFIDEEAIPPETVQYVTRVRQNPDVQLDWYCLPIKHRNACSLEQPFWTCWNPKEKHLWVRKPPKWAILEHEKFEAGQAYQDWLPKVYPTDIGSVALLSGIRAEESIRRTRLVMMKKNDCFLQAKADYMSVYRAFPIYDWKSTDVWKLIADFGYDYNKTYDIVNHTRFHNRLLAQRVCQPFGEEPLRSLWLYAECWPEQWHKLLKRVPGVSAAWRYANTDLYLINQKPDDLTWKEYTVLLMENYAEPKAKERLRHHITKLIAKHQRKTPEPIPEVDPHPYTGTSWKFLAKIAGSGDFKSRKADNLLDKANKVQRNLGITAAEAKKRHGWTAD